MLAPRITKNWWFCNINLITYHTSRMQCRAHCKQPFNTFIWNTLIEIIVYKRMLSIHLPLKSRICGSLCQFEFHVLGRNQDCKGCVSFKSITDILVIIKLLNRLVYFKSLVAFNTRFVDFRHHFKVNYTCNVYYFNPYNYLLQQFIYFVRIGS